MDALASQASEASAYGQAVWSCPRDAGVKFVGDDPASDGGKKARFTGESTEQPFNHRAGNAGVISANLW